MSVHKSLVAKGRLKRHRNVLTRTERIGRLEDEEKWEPEKDSVFCLPKVRVAKLKKSHAKKKEAEGDEAVEGAAAAKPAADK
jgi:small basic protein (TIGR04137 family)